MDHPPPGSALAARLSRMFPPGEVAAATALLEARCGSGLPLIEAQGESGIERVRCAALKLSDGSLAKLDEAVRVANQDWRDVLVAAGFAGGLEAHRDWLEREDRG